MRAADVAGRTAGGTAGGGQPGEPFTLRAAEPTARVELSPGPAVRFPSRRLAGTPPPIPAGTGAPRRPTGRQTNSTGRRSAAQTEPGLPRLRDPPVLTHLPSAHARQTPNQRARPVARPTSPLGCVPLPVSPRAALEAGPTHPRWAPRQVPHTLLVAVEPRGLVLPEGPAAALGTLSACAVLRHTQLSCVVSTRLLVHRGLCAPPGW